MKVNEISTNNSAPIRVYGSFTVHLRLATWVLNSTQITNLVIKVFLSRDHLNTFRSAGVQTYIGKTSFNHCHHIRHAGCPLIG